MTQFEKIIKAAIDREDEKIAGWLASYCQTKMGMNYHEILARVQQVCPEVDMPLWDGLMYEFDTFNDRYGEKAHKIMCDHVKEICY